MTLVWVEIATEHALTLHLFIIYRRIECYGTALGGNGVGNKQLRRDDKAAAMRYVMCRNAEGNVELCAVGRVGSYDARRRRCCNGAVVVVCGTSRKEREQRRGWQEI